MDGIKAKAFLAVKRTGSFSKAAEEFNYTPSAFSHIADGLESELGVKLFNRTNHGVTLTTAGKVLSDYFTAYLAAENELVEKARTFSQTGEIKIGAFSTISQFILPKIIKDYKMKNPSVKISLYVGDDAEKTLFSGASDVVFSDGINADGCEILSIENDPFVAIFPSDSKMKRTVDKEELYNNVFITTGEEAVEKNLDMSRFKDVVRLKSDDYASVVSMVKEGVGISVIPKLSLGRKVKGVATAEIKPEFSRTLCALYKKESKNRACVNRFIEYLKMRFGV